MNKPFQYVLLAIILLCGLAGFPLEISAQVVPQGDVAGVKEACSIQVWSQAVAHEAGHGTRDVMRPSPPPRLASSRPVRLLLTPGGKSGGHKCRWSGYASFHFLKFSSCGSMCCSQQHTSVVPQRDYYVIALRRLLC